MSTDGSLSIEDLRHQVDAIDLAIINLLDRRQSLSAEIQVKKLDTGQSRVDLRREREIVAEYQRLGVYGPDIAYAILSHCRGGLHAVHHEPEGATVPPPFVLR